MVRSDFAGDDAEAFVAVAVDPNPTFFCALFCWLPNELVLALAIDAPGRPYPLGAPSVSDDDGDEAGDRSRTTGLQGVCVRQ